MVATETLAKREGGRRNRVATYCPQLTITTPSSTRASLKPELKAGAVGFSLQLPTHLYPFGFRYSGKGMWMNARSMCIWVYSLCFLFSPCAVLWNQDIWLG